MRGRLFCLLGLAGTGKTFSILAKMQERVREGSRCMYLTFNKALQVSTAKKLQMVSEEVYTFHGFCHRTLKMIGKGDEFDAVMKEEGKQEKTKAFDLLISKFLEEFSKDGVPFPISGIDAVFIDEFQNLPKNLVPVVSLLAQKPTVDFYVCGDPIQAIAHYNYGDPKHFENVEAVFEKEPEYLPALRTNHRSKVGPLMTVNSFLGRQFPKRSAGLSYILPEGATKNEDRTKVYVITSPNEEAAFVVEKIGQLRKVGNQTIAVLARSNRQLEVVRTALEVAGYRDREEHLISLSTIHGNIGGEADVVFLIGVEVPEFGDYRMKNKNRDEAPEESRVLYVGLSRARERLIVTSPCAMAELEVLFGDGVEIEDLRKNTGWEKRDFPSISRDRREKYLTERRYGLSIIDSIAIKLDAVDVPWLPYIVDKNPPSKWERQKNFEVDGVSIYVKRNLSYGFYVFRLSDTNTLKRSGFTDQDILNFLRYAVCRFFNAAVPVERAKVVRLDLCRLYRRGDITIGRIRNDLKNYPQIAVGEDGKIVERAHATARDTLYYHIRAHYGFQVVFYGPANKTNRNRLYNEDLYKIEVRLQGECIGKRGYSDGLATFGQLVEQLTTKSNLETWYWKALRYAGFDNPTARRYTPPKSEWFHSHPGDKYDDDTLGLEMNA